MQASAEHNQIASDKAFAEFLQKQEFEDHSKNVITEGKQEGHS
jgi:hypothetical protein